MGHKVIAPLVVADPGDGKLGYFYRGSVIPELSPADEKRFLAYGFISAVDDAPESAATPVPVEPVASEKVEPKSVPAVEKPSNTDLKSAWVEYGVSTGKLKSRDAGDAYSKPELIKLLG